MKAKLAKRCKNRANGFQPQILEDHILEAVKDVVAAILFKNEKVLIAQRAKDDPLAGLWEFPGGKVEDGESPEDSLIQEMQEEFCIDIFLI
jgi:mutator protein MutT